MGKINLSTTTLNHQSKQGSSLSTVSKYRLSLGGMVLFLNTLVLLYFLPVTFIQAQYYNQTSEFLKANSHWAFGTRTGLEFSSGTAQSFSTAITLSEASAAVSDRNTGNLLFYTNGGSVWNANHSIMPNGTGLMGNSISNSYSTLQGALIVPFINDSNKYYLFSLTYQGNIDFNTSTGKKGSLFYNVVDMRLDNGNGDVDTNYKNIVLDTNSLSEALIAIAGCNNDIWVLVHSFDQPQPVYKAYHVTESGVNLIPVISPSLLHVDIVGSMAASPDRYKVVFASIGIGSELSHFDPSTGIVAGSINFFSTAGNTGHVFAAFSPDNSKLYLTEFLSGISQYDISVFDSTIIASSKNNVHYGNSYGIRLYNDTIYTADLFGMGPGIVHQINQPNNSGAACSLQLNAITLSSSNVFGTLGSDVVLHITRDTLLTKADTTICTSDWENGISLTATDTFSTSYIWSTGDSTSSIKIKNQGLYWVKYGKCNEYYIDSFIMRGSNLFTIITVNGFELGITGGPFASYQWYLNGEPIPGANRSTHTVTENGHYTIEITDNYGCVYISDVYEVTNVNIEDLQRLAGAISIYPNPATETINIDAPVPVQAILTGIDGKELLKGNNASPVNIGSITQGFYFLTVTNIEGRVLKREKIIKQ